MKKSIFAMALLFVLGSAAMAQSQANSQQVLKKITSQLHGGKQFDVYRPEFVVVENDEYKTRYYYTYDEDYFLTTLEEQSLEGSTWTTDIISIYDYDWNGNVREIFIKNAMTDEELSLESFIYDSNGNLSEDTYCEWDGSQWVNVSKLVFDFSETMTTVLLWEWNGTTWASSYYFTYTQNGNTEELLVQYMQGGAWQDEQRITTTYNDNGTKAEILVEFIISNAWENTSKSVYHYTNGLFDVVNTYMWDEGTWKDNSKCEYQYDNHGNAISGAIYCKEGSNWNSCYGTMEMAYDNNYEVIEFDGTGYTATYIDLTGVEEKPEANFICYPNPVSETLTVRSDDFQKAEVYSLTGAKLAETTSNQVDVSKLQAGTYLLKVYGKERGCQARVFVVK